MLLILSNEHQSTGLTLFSTNLFPALETPVTNIRKLLWVMHTRDNTRDIEIVKACPTFVIIPRNSRPGVRQPMENPGVDNAHNKERCFNQQLCIVSLTHATHQHT